MKMQSFQAVKPRTDTSVSHRDTTKPKLAPTYKIIANPNLWLSIKEGLYGMSI